MIEIAIDEKACVSCGLCIEACPTSVFTFDDAQDLPQVAKAAECFGCLSCSEICPSDAIQHDQLPTSRCFYHDPYAVDVARKLSTRGGPLFEIIDDDPGREGAMGDLVVRLLSVAVVLKDIMGTGLAPVGLMAGRALATQLPRYQPPRNLEEALDLAQREFSPAWQLDFQLGADDTLAVEVGECFVRDVCTKGGMDMGGELCVLFYNYLAGYLSKMAGTRLRLAGAERAAGRCAYQVKVQG
jgi:ferredoxin